MIEELYVIYRPIGCDDEASTDEEQGEKILFSYPKQSLFQQLKRITMLEGLIDFTSRFSEQDIDTVAMEKHTWSFLQPEPGLWLVACASYGDISPDSEGEQHSPKVSGPGLVDALSRMYTAFVSFRGNVVHIIEGHENAGLNAINEVQGLRKKVRKIRRRLEQEELDYENIRHDSVRMNSSNVESGEERVGIKASESLTVEQFQEAIDASNMEIASLEGQLTILVDPSSSSPYFAVTSLRRALASFFHWYLDSGELCHPNGLHGMGGMHYCTVGHPAFQALTRVRQAVEDITQGQCQKTVILHDGQVVWSDCDDVTTFALYEFVRMQENTRQRLMVRIFEQRKRQQVAATVATKARRRSNSMRGGGFSRLSIGGGTDDISRNGNGGLVDELRGAAAGATPEEWLQAQVDHSGFVTRGWGIRDLLEQPWSVEEKEEGKQREVIETQEATRGLDDPLVSEYKGMWEGLLGPRDLFFPRLYSAGGKNWDNNDNDNGEVWDDDDEDDELSLGEDIKAPQGPVSSIGRVLIYRQACFFLALVLPDVHPERGEDKDLEEEKGAKSNGSDSPEEVKRQKLLSITSLSSLLPEDQRSRSASAYFPAAKESRSHSHSSLEHACGSVDEVEELTQVRLDQPDGLMNLCNMLQFGLCDVLDQLLLLLGNKNKHLSVYGLQWQWKAALLRHAEETAEGGRRMSVSGRPNGEAGEPSLPPRPPGDEIGEGSSSHKEVNLPFMDPSLTIPLPQRPPANTGGMPTGVRAYYFNASNRAIKAPDIYLGEVDPLLFWPQPVVVDTEKMHHRTRDVGISEVLSDQYLSNLLSLFRHRFPLPAAFLATTLHPQTVEAINEVRETLTCRYNRSSTCCAEVCLRLSSSQRGGHWLVGRRRGGRFLIVMIEGCPALSDMHKSLLKTIDGVFSRVIV